MNFKRLVGFIILTILTISKVMAYEQAYPRTEVDKIEVKTLPTSQYIQTTLQGEYFDHSDDLFQRLFSYIKDNEVSMTIPVEAGIDEAEMRFYLDPGARADLQSSETVDLVELPAREVASLGGRGSYSAENIAAATDKLQQWLQQQNEWQTDGEAYAVYWNGPFTLWFLKRYEIHIPVKARQQQNGN